MAILKKLEKLLAETKHKVIEHKKVFTAFDSTQTQHLKPAEVAKAVLVKGKPTGGGSASGGKGLYLAVLPAGSLCDFKALSKLVGDKVSMAKEKDIEKNMKTKVGLVAPFGTLYGLPVYLDKKLTKAKKINLPAGSYTESVELSVKDYMKLQSPVLGNFSKKR